MLYEVITRGGVGSSFGSTGVADGQLGKVEASLFIEQGTDVVVVQSDGRDFQFEWADTSIDAGDLQALPTQQVFAVIEVQAINAIDAKVAAKASLPVSYNFV